MTREEAKAKADELCRTWSDYCGTETEWAFHTRIADALMEAASDWRERYVRLAEAARPIAEYGNRLGEKFRDGVVISPIADRPDLTLGHLRKLAAELKR